MNNESVKNTNLMYEVARDAVAKVKPNKTCYFKCPICGYTACAKKDMSGRVKAFCQGCNTRVNG